MLPATARVPAAYPGSSGALPVRTTATAAAAHGQLPRTPPRASASRAAGHGGATAAVAAAAAAAGAPAVEPSTPTYTSAAHQCVRAVNTQRRGTARKSTDRPPQGLRGGVRAAVPTTATGTVGSGTGSLQAGPPVWPVQHRGGTGRGNAGPGAVSGLDRQGVAAGSASGIKATVAAHITAAALPAGSMPGSRGHAEPAPVTPRRQMRAPSPPQQQPPLLQQQQQHTPQQLQQTLQQQQQQHSPLPSHGQPQVQPHAQHLQQQQQDQASHGMAGAPSVAASRAAALVEDRHPEPRGLPAKEREPVPSPLSPHNERTLPPSAPAEEPRKLRPQLYQNYPTRGLYA